MTVPSWRMQPQGSHANSPHRQKKTAVIQKRHRSSPASSSSDDEGDADHNGELPLLHRTKNNNVDDQLTNNEGVGKKRRKILYYMIPLLLLFVYRIISGSVIFRSTSATYDDDASIYGPPTNATNPFIARYEHSLLTNLGSDPFIPLLYGNDKLLCRRKHKAQLSRYRTRYFAQMVRTGLAIRTSGGTKQPPPPSGKNDSNNNNNNNTSFHTTHNYDDDDNDDDGLPILVIDGDENGCNIQPCIDTYTFPRLTWSDLSSKHTTTTTTTTNRTNTTNKRRSSCNTISMPSYETYKYYHRSHRTSHDWEATFTTNAHHYPWQSKLPKAVWRGSTTYEGSQFTNSKLQDTPRGQLVLIGKEHEDLMDVGFHKILQQYANDKVELAKQFPMKSRMSPKDYMRYRAIIDIDGNNWSSRFGMLLCSNSIVIKIEPDFVEYFYGENGPVRPNIHYLPASLDNITEVVSYAMDAANDEQLKGMIASANNWCKDSLSEEGLARDALQRLEVFGNALDLYNNGSWKTEWNVVKKRFTDTIDDFVDCNAWSFVDWFAFLMFAGL